MDEVEQGIYHTGPKLINVNGEASATHATLRCLGKVRYLIHHT